jgi:hypothetical protein
MQDKKTKQIINKVVKVFDKYAVYNPLQYETGDGTKCVYVAFITGYKWKQLRKDLRNIEVR